MVLCNLGLIFISRAGGRTLRATLRSPNRPEAIVTTGALLLVVVALFVPPVTRLFVFEPISFGVLGLSVCAAAGSLIVAGLARRWTPR
jgi:hypothetical protein